MNLGLKLIFSLLIIQLPCAASEPQVKGVSEGSIKTNFDCACQYYDEKNYDLAIPKFEYVVQNTNDLNLQITSQFCLGVMYFNQKEYKEAQNFLDYVTKQKLNMNLKIKAHGLLRRIFKCSRESAKSAHHHKMAKEFEQELIQGRYEIFGHFKEALDLHKNKKNCEAIKILRIIIKNNYDLVLKAKANYLIGTIYLDEKDYVKAGHCFEDGVKQKDCIKTRIESCVFLTQMIIEGQSRDFSCVRRLLMGFICELLEANDPKQFGEIIKQLEELVKQVLKIENKERRAKKTFCD